MYVSFVEPMVDGVEEEREEKERRKRSVTPEPSVGGDRSRFLKYKLQKG